MGSPSPGQARAPPPTKSPLSLRRGRENSCVSPKVCSKGWEVLFLLVKPPGERCNLRHPCSSSLSSSHLSCPHQPRPLAGPAGLRPRAERLLKPPPTQEAPWTVLTSGGCVLFLGWLWCSPARQRYRQAPPAAKWVLPRRELTLTRQPAWRRLRGAGC